MCTVLLIPAIYAWQCMTPHHAIATTDRELDYMFQCSCRTTRYTAHYVYNLGRVQLSRDMKRRAMDPLVALRSIS